MDENETHADALDRCRWNLKLAEHRTDPEAVAIWKASCFSIAREIIAGTYR